MFQLVIQRIQECMISILMQQKVNRFKMEFCTCVFSTIYSAWFAANEYVTEHAFFSWLLSYLLCVTVGYINRINFPTKILTHHVRNKGENDAVTKSFNGRIKSALSEFISQEHLLLSSLYFWFWKIKYFFLPSPFSESTSKRCYFFFPSIYI